MDETNLYEMLFRSMEAEGGLAYTLAVFGDTIAEREGYKSSDLRQMEAVYFYIVHKFQWLPSEVRGMSTEDLRFVLSEEMQGWTVPKAARPQNFLSQS